MTGVIGQLQKFLKSEKFFSLVLLLFIFQAVWIAFSAVYPQPFDENTHLATIRLYSHHWSPFITSQPTGSGALGAVTRDPSYLYQYLLSFPYRVFAHFMTSLSAQVIFLRFFGIAFFATSLVLFKKVMEKTHSSRAIINVTMLFFVLIPIVPFLAGQINYDNLLMLFVAGSLLLCLNFLERVNLNRRIDVVLGLYVLSVSLLGCLVQAEFLPILLAIATGIFYVLARALYLGKKIKVQYPKLNSASSILSILLILISSGLFFQRYGINYLRYHTLVPKCDQVLSINECELNGSWSRAQKAEQTKGAISKSPVRYSISWVYRMFEYSFFTRSGGNKKAYYVNINPLPLIAITAMAVFGFGILLFLRYGHDLIKQNSNLAFLLYVSVLYLFILWLHLYGDYLKTGQKFGINGRYLLPAILPVMLAIGLSYERFLAGLTKVKTMLFAVVFLLFLQGGGIVTFIVGSNRYWYWNSQIVRDMNGGAQKIINPLVVKRLSAEDSAKNKLLDKFHGH